jgi:hypothetical protein
VNPVAVINTSDGAQVLIEARGFARPLERGKPQLGRRGDAAICERGRPLPLARQRPWLWEREFDAEAHRARYQAYLVSDGGSGVQP